MVWWATHLLSILRNEKSFKNGMVVSAAKYYAQMTL